MPKRVGKEHGRYKHGMRGTPTYNSWKSMKQRCSNPKALVYQYYGGIGIRFCEKWNSFEGFLEDMGERPAGTTLDRIESDKDYCKENCRWATQEIQDNNRKNHVLISAFGQTKTQAQWAKELGCHSSAISARLRLGWSPEDAVSKPVQTWAK